MSHSTMYGVPKKGEIRALEEYQNSHGTAPVIWGYLYDKYVPKAHSYDCWGTHNEKLWALSDDPRLSRHEKICLWLTFDHCMVKTKDIPVVVEALRQLYKDTFNPEYVNHLSKLADDMEALQKSRKFVALCFIWTSVADDIWDSQAKPVCDKCGHEEDDYCGKWDLSKEEGHWFLFDEIDRKDEGDDKAP